jgi:hypothetical protein
MSVTAMPNNATQVERAVRAWLIECGAGTEDDYFISTDYRKRPQSEIFSTIVAATSRHSPEVAGNEIWQVAITHFYPANVPPDHESPDSYRAALDERVGLQMAALAQSDDEHTLQYTVDAITTAGRNLTAADMAEFTCLFLRYLGASRGKPEDESCAWVEVRNYEITAAALALS